MAALHSRPAARPSRRTASDGYVTPDPRLTVDARRADEREVASERAICAHLARAYASVVDFMLDCRDALVRINAAKAVRDRAKQRARWEATMGARDVWAASHGTAAGRPH